MPKSLFLIITILYFSCSKNTDSAARQQTAGDPQITNVSWITIYSSPSIPNIKWGFTLTVPDTTIFTKLTLNRISPNYIAVTVDNPRSKTYSIYQPGYKCPSYIDNAYFYFEWTKANGDKVRQDTVRVWEN